MVNSKRFDLLGQILAQRARCSKGCSWVRSGEPTLVAPFAGTSSGRPASART